MRLSHVLLVVAASFLATCGATPASTQTKLSHETAADHVQSVEIDSPIKRFLRTTETAAAVEKDEDKDEERAFHVQFLKKLNLPTYFGSPVGKDKTTFAKTYVTALLKDKELRERTFHDWAKRDLDVQDLKKSLGGLTKKHQVELFNRYTAYRGELARRSGNDLAGNAWSNLARDVAK